MNATPCIFQTKDHEFSEEGSLIVVVAGCGQVGRGPRGGQREALSTASGPVRAQPELSPCTEPRAAVGFAVGAPNPIRL